MISPQDHKPHKPPAAIRIDARLDAMTRQKVDDLARYFHQPRAAVLSQIMQWGLSRGETLDQGESQGPVRHLHLYVASDLHEQVEKAAIAAGVKAAPWLRHMVRQVTITDFPASWQEATPSERSHDSRTIPSASCCGWMNPHRPNSSNSSTSLAPQKPQSSAISSPKRNPMIFQQAGR